VGLGAGAGQRTPVAWPNATAGRPGLWGAGSYCEVPFEIATLGTALGAPDGRKISQSFFLLFQPLGK
jgi:hypothetical protein